MRQFQFSWFFGPVFGKKIEATVISMHRFMTFRMFNGLCWSRCCPQLSHTWFWFHNFVRSVLQTDKSGSDKPYVSCEISSMLFRCLKFSKLLKNISGHSLDSLTLRQKELRRFNHMRTMLRGLVPWNDKAVGLHTLSSNSTRLIQINYMFERELFNLRLVGKPNLILI